MRSPRQWFYDMLSKGEPPVVDEDQLVEAGLVNLPAGPMVVASLREAGLRVTSSDIRTNVYDAVPKTVIFCRAGDLRAVRQIIDDVTTL